MRPTPATMLQQNNNNNYPCLSVSGSTREMLQKCSRASLPFPSRLELGLGDLPLIRGLRAWALCSKNRRKPGALGGGPAPTTPPAARGGSTPCPRPADVYLSGEWVRMGYGLPLGLDVKQAGIGALVTVATLKTSEGNGKTQTQCLFLQTENGSCLYSTSKPGAGVTTGSASSGVGGWLRGKAGGGAGRDAQADIGPGLQSQTRNQVRVRSGRRWRKSGNVVSRERLQTSEGDPCGERQERPNKGVKELAGPGAQCCHGASPKTCAQCERKAPRKQNKEEHEERPRGDDRGVEMKDMKKKEEEEEEGKEGRGGFRGDESAAAEMSRDVEKMRELQGEEEPKTPSDEDDPTPPQRPSDHGQDPEEEEERPPVGTPEGGGAVCGTARIGSGQQHPGRPRQAEQGIVGKIDPDVGDTVNEALGETGAGSLREGDQREVSPAGFARRELSMAVTDGSVVDEAGPGPENTGDESAEALTDERANTRRRDGGAAEDGNGQREEEATGGQRGERPPGADVTHVARADPSTSPALTPANPAPSPPPLGAMATGLPCLEAAGISATGAGGREGSGEHGGELESREKSQEQEEEEEEEEEEDEFGGFMQAEGEPAWNESFAMSVSVPCGSKGSAALGNNAIGNSSDWTPGWTEGSFHQSDDDAWTAFPQDGADGGGASRGQWWPAGAQDDRADAPLENHNLAALFAEAFPLMPDSSPSDPCDTDTVPTLAQLLGGGASQDKGLLDSFHDLNKMIGQRNKRARGMSRDLLLRTLRFEQPPPLAESRAAPWSASRRLSPGHPPSAPHHTHNAAAKRRLSYDYNRNIME